MSIANAVGDTSRGVSASHIVQDTKTYSTHTIVYMFYMCMSETQLGWEAPYTHESTRRSARRCAVVTRRLWRFRPMMRNLQT